MQFFTKDEFLSKYTEYSSADIPTWQIEAVCEMIFSQVGLIYRDASWNETSVPLPIKNASMEQMRFMLTHDIPFIDYDKTRYIPNIFRSRRQRTHIGGSYRLMVFARSLG